MNISQKTCRNNYHIIHIAISALPANRWLAASLVVTHVMFSYGNEYTVETDGLYSIHILYFNHVPAIRRCLWYLETNRNKHVSSVDGTHARTIINYTRFEAPSYP